MSDETTPPPVASQAGTAVRDITILISALPALIAVLGTRDVSKIADFLAGTQFAPALGVITAGAVMIWRQMHARKVRQARPATTVTGPAIVTPLDGGPAA
jgi:hypothetical protein